MKLVETQSQIGVILRKSPYGESDLIVTALLAEGGLRRFFAKGARISRKRFGGRLELFTHVKLSYRSKLEGLWLLTEAENLPGAIVNWSEPSAFAAAGFFAELICAFHPEGVDSGSIAHFWQEFEGHVRDLGQMSIRSDRLLKAFWQILGLFGYALSFQACVRCKAIDGAGRFQPALGGFVCQNCLQGQLGPSLDVSSRSRLAADLPIDSALVLDLFNASLSFVEGVLHKPIKSAPFVRSILALS